MRPVIVQEFVTLDGVMQAPGDGHDHPAAGWQRQFIGEDHVRLIVEQMREADGLLLGRTTYEEFAAVWPHQRDTNGLAERMNEMPKFVASTTLTSVSWNATLLSGDVAGAVAQLKETPGNGLVVVGSRKLAMYLHQHDLVDEYRLWLHPVIVGSGDRLFEEGLNPATWHLFDVESTGEGVLVATYRRRPHH
ncbi:MAG: dihydrofolate reductase family protein [Acidimicrobiales bacterium]